MRVINPDSDSGDAAWYITFVSSNRSKFEQFLDVRVLSLPQIAILFCEKPNVMLNVLALRHAIGN